MTQDFAEVLATVYDPQPVEARWWQAWEGARLFSAPDQATKSGAFSVVIPPPNVTGSLHMGHALNNTLQDILVRYQRMQGKAVLWVFGMDHAGIATQNVVERQLKAEGKSRQDLGREAFIERVWKWKEESGGSIRNQLKRLGCSLDYEHERFTMDEGLSRAVREVFVRLYEEKKIYRAQRLINWCPRCHTALSDLEVEYEEVQGHLWHIRYAMENNPQEGLVVATTRPETLLGDTAVAVHPEDERYRNWVGRRLKLPFVDRCIPVVADAMVDPEFGSGVVKLTPAHDFNDFEAGNRHGLERINVLTEEGRMSSEAGPFVGQDRWECRKNIVKALEESDDLIRVEEHKNRVGHCYRCKTVVEPYLSMQWFVATSQLAHEAMVAVQNHKTRIIPEQWQNTYFRWMENIQDWCISRQIWWGHRIPVWYCGVCADGGAPHRGIWVSREDLLRCPQCGNEELQQDTDVLDTWFSSALWPFSTLGWPETTARLQTYYPTSVLITGFDIIFFWVARMMMMGLEFTGEVPFRDVYIHALVRDSEGQKMSKSKGNVLDPLVVMEKFGTDAFRFTLAAFAAQGRDIKLGEERILGYRNFCNKVWNAARLVLATVLPHCDMTQASVESSHEIEATHPVSQWMLLELNRAVAELRVGFDEYRFNEAAQACYRFFWSVYCDWFLELIKPVLRSEQAQDQALKREFSNLAVFVLDQALRLLHPIMPFITEELWQVLLSRENQFLAKAAFPQVLGESEVQVWTSAHDQVDAAMAVVEKIRQILMETGAGLKVTPAKVSVYSKDEKKLVDIERILPMVGNLIRLPAVTLNDPGLRAEKGIARGVTRYRDVVVLVDLKGLVDLEKERARQQKELKFL